MKMFVNWDVPIVLTAPKDQTSIYSCDLSKIDGVPGIYVFARRFGKSIEALYVGKANSLESRVRTQFNNVRLMMHIQNASTGARVLVVGKFKPRPRQTAKVCLPIIERALIRHFLLQGHDLVNVQGTRLHKHEVTSTGWRAAIPREMLVE